MTWAEWALLVGAVLVVVLWAVWVEASRIDRLHRKVAASYAMLDKQLVRRAAAAVELASTGVLDPVSSVLVADAAFAALDAGGAGGASAGPLNPVPADLARLIDAQPGTTSGRTSSTTSSTTSSGVAGTTSSGVSRTGVSPSIRLPHGPADDRGLAESELSATLRAALEDEDEVAAIRAEPGGEELVEALAAAWFRVQLARRFHNEAVAQTRRVRAKALVRTLRLAGRAPLPHPFDIDDAWPAALGRPGAAAPVREV